MQRLYSTFARGWPGIGLLFLRVTAAITAFHFGGSASGLNWSSMAVIEGALPSSFAPVCGHRLRVA